jgi:hypothetical protein
VAPDPQRALKRTCICLKRILKGGVCGEGTCANNNLQAPRALEVIQPRGLNSIHAGQHKINKTKILRFRIASRYHHARASNGSFGWNRNRNAQRRHSQSHTRDAPSYKHISHACQAYLECDLDQTLVGRPSHCREGFLVHRQAHHCWQYILK